MIADLKGKTIITAKDLKKNYGLREAVRSISFEVKAQSCFGLLGPNGAGKSSTLKMIYGAIPPTSGSLSIMEMDIHKESRNIKALLGIVPQEENLDPELNVLENLIVFARYFKISKLLAQQRAFDLLKLFHLEERAGSKVDELSTGLKKRLLIARGLINDPKVLILDEPTTGLDPQSRHLIWQRLRHLKSKGLTILITSHYMEEATQLCDSVVIIDQGKILKNGAPLNLVHEGVGNEIIEIRIDPHYDSEIIHSLNSESYKHERIADTLYLYCEDGRSILKKLAAFPHQKIIHRPATLEDLFLKLTGRELSE
jgi:lipooligosaccharide transport system ATP-binding protein